MKKAIFLVVPLIALLIFAVFFKSQLPILKVYAGPADAMGNDIVFVEVWQYDGETWILKANFTSEGQDKLDENQQVRFIVCIKYNATLASSESEAIQYTRVYMNITYNSNIIWQNKELNNTSCTLANGFYWLKEQGDWNSNLPQQGITYNVKVLYQSYW